ncbi:MAG TPA: polysaccharide pyruvyl transferase family protein [Acetobacteraceae bacterium]|nr:polysaccharide pyruvyl transferase family protein [Acetobacteraceae bacterium]
MQLYHWRGAVRNFGDELNTVLWPRLLPDFFDDDPAELFLGIGSVLDVQHDVTATKLVAGAGYGGYRAPPVLDANWIVHWVRGPRTARLLGLPEALGLGDPAMLLAVPGNGCARSIGFMPHFESLARGAWAEAASAAGVTLIDPRDDPSAILAAIGNCHVLLSEAMHGVIVADAMRVPWVALRPLVPVHRAKWYDWADALALRICFRPLTASSLPERLHASPLASPHRIHRLLDFASPVLAGVARRRFIEQAAQSLAAAAAATPQLSAAAALDRCRTRMLERLAALRRNPRQPAACALHPSGHSAYQG